jgi:hypothetical protein
VLRPEEREDRELEVVRLALEQLQDACVLAVREAELAVEGLFRDRAQAVSLAVEDDGTEKRIASSSPRCLLPRCARILKLGTFGSPGMPPASRSRPVPENDASIPLGIVRARPHTATAALRLRSSSRDPP